MRRTNFLLGICLGGSLFAQVQTPPGLPTAPTAPTQSVPPITMPTNTPNTVKVDDKKFANEAEIGGMTEVQLGKLALQKASRDDVKQFAQKMVDDHTKVDDDLKQVAAKENISLAGTLDKKHQQRIDKLSKLSGAQFEKAYIKDQVKDHDEDVKEFTAESQSGSNAAVMGFASIALPTLQQHLAMVKKLAKKK